MTYTRSIFRTVTTFILVVVMLLGVAGPTLASTSLGSDGLGSMTSHVSRATAELDTLNFDCASQGFSLKALSCAGAAMSYYTMLGSSKLAGVGGILLNIAIQELVVNYGLLVNELSTTTGAVWVTWKLLRDLADIILVFVLVFIGIATIVGANRFGYKQMLFKVIIAALLVNFSITLAKFVIDVGNSLAIATYAELIQLEPAAHGGAGNDACWTSSAIGTVSAGDATTKVCIERGIAAMFMEKLKINTLFSATGVAGMSGNTVDSSSYDKVLWVGFFGTIFFLILGFVLAAGGVLLIGRAIILLMLIIFSPIAFLAWVTNISRIGSFWWNKLLGQTFFAPFMFLAWYIAYRVIGSTADLLGGTDMNYATSLEQIGGATAAPDVGLFDIFMVFAIASGFLILGLIVAQRMGAAGANATMRMGRNMARASGGFMYAHTAGRASAFAAERYRRHAAKMQEMDGDNYKRNSAFARAYRGLGVGKGGKVDRYTQAALGAGATHGVLGAKSFSQRHADDIRASGERNAELTTVARQNNLRDAAQVVRDYETLDGNGGFTPKEYEAAKTTVGTASTGDIEAVRQTNRGLMNHESVVNNIGKAQATALSKDEKLRGTEKVAHATSAYKNEQDAIKRVTEIQKALANGDPLPDGMDVGEVEKHIRKMTPTDVKNNKILFAKNPAAMRYVSPDMFSSIVSNKDDTWSPEQIDSFRKERYGDLQEKLGEAPGDEDTQKMVHGMDNKDLEMVGDDTYATAGFWENLDQRQYNHLTRTKRSNFTPTQLEFAANARKAHFANMDPDKLQTSLKSMRGEELAGLDKETLAKGAPGLNPGALNELSKHASSEKMDAVEEEIRTKYEPVQEKLAAHKQAMDEYEQKLRKAKGRATVTGTGERSGDDAVSAVEKTKPQAPQLSREEQQIVKLHKWFNPEGGRPHV